MEDNRRCLLNWLTGLSKLPWPGCRFPTTAGGSSISLTATGSLPTPARVCSAFCAHSMGTESWKAKGSRWEQLCLWTLLNTRIIAYLLKNGKRKTGTKNRFLGMKFLPNRNSWTLHTRSQAYSSAWEPSYSELNPPLTLRNSFQYLLSYQLHGNNSAIFYWKKLSMGSN